MTAPLRVLIADDEPLARERLRELLSTRDDAVPVGEARNGAEAVRLVREHRAEGEPVDLLLLDVEMPELDGLAALDALSPEERPGVVFVTAYDRYALRAFDLHALDYLLKPFDDERFHAALDRACDALRRGEAASLTQRLLALLRQSDGDPAEVTRADTSDDDTSSANDGEAPLTRLAIRTGSRYHLVEVDEIDWIEGAGVYARLVVGDKAHLLRTPLAELERRLDSERFVRIHRSTIVNLDRVREARGHAHGEYVLGLRDGTRLKVSRTYSDRIRQFLDGLS
ncbi:MAG TPA: response regulator transcription factor [Bacteroidetes bacterium]|nr:response regulator transcription factor [Bacteroidota bacterium]HIL58980.1 response regulator transcription factor [Rhodothermales bacterium]